MSKVGMTAIELLVDDVVSVVTTLSTEEWDRASRCPGWRVKDLVAHMSSNFRLTAEPPPPAPEPQPATTAEQAMEALVSPRRDWAPAEILAEYLDYAPKALAVLRHLQSEPLASTVTPLADLGSYQMHQLADAYAFDHYCHLRVDLLAPDGPVARPLAPAAPDQVHAAVGWMLTGLPQMQGTQLEFLSVPIRLQLTGPGGGTWTITPGHPLTVLDGDRDFRHGATITSDAHAFVLWGTNRKDWRFDCSIEGDVDVAAAQFLDAMNII